jgi:ArsR family transcriptional regulator, arsenate/arsenite/antimonite-responsive transcriptional repressor
VRPTLQAAFWLSPRGGHGFLTDQNIRALTIAAWENGALLDGCKLPGPDYLNSFLPLSKCPLDTSQYFHNYGNMKKHDVLAALAALAQENRLDAYRLLVQAGPEGMPAGEVAARLRLAPNTLTFHFDRLRDAALVTVRRQGRSMIYAARFDTMNALLAYLTENCCQGAEACAPAACKPVAPAQSSKKERVS